MFVPISTDAPIYHRPVGTIGLIVLNVGVFCLLLAAPDLEATLSLPHGRGLTPAAWITSNFVHAGIFHLLGNVMFLWGFGLIVEGKLGWKQFVPIFLLIGAAECLLEQILFRNAAGSSCGASSIVFGLMAMALIWAPRNELTVLYWFITRPGMIDVSVTTLAVLTFLQSAAFIVAGAHASAELLHLVGAAVGAVIGLALLQTGTVDCEGWDLISWLRGRHPVNALKTMPWQHQAAVRRRQQKRVRRAHSTLPPPALVPSALHPSPERFAALVVKCKPLPAYEELQRLRTLESRFQPSPEELLTIARGLRQIQQWNPCVEMYEEFLQRQPKASAAKLELAELLVLIQERPAAAQRLLETCEENTLTPAQTTRFHTLTRQIQELKDSGVIELEGRAW
jgi:membrane associated rhomboid family serine protease